MTSIEQDKLAKRIQEFRTQAELDSLKSSADAEVSASGDGVHVLGTSCYKDVEALMQSAAKGEVSFIGILLFIRMAWNLK